MLLTSLALGLQMGTGPVLPPGCDSSLSNAVQQVEQSLQRSDFKAAQAKAIWLPGRQITIRWKDQNVPASIRPAFAAARDRAIEAWKKAIPALKIVVGNPGTIDVSFVESFPIAPDDLVPIAAKHKVNIDNQRRIVSMLSLARGSKGMKSTPMDIQNEVGYAIGAYLGLTRSPIYTQIMGRTDQPNTVLAKVGADEALWATECLAAADVLRGAIASKTPIKRSFPVADIRPIEPAITDTLQGDKPIYTLTLKNNGTSQLRYRLASTCACMEMERTGSVEPGETKKVEVELDTTEFIGKLSKILYVYTNDGDLGTLELPIKSNITPQYRMLCPQGTAYVMSGKSTEFDVFLALPEKSKLNPLRASVDGMDAEVSMFRWAGKLADPALEEGELQRKGYRIHVSVPDQNIVGRRPGTLTVTTDNFTFRLLQFNFTVQKGIVALPLSVYFGQAKPGSRASSTLSRPGKPFNVKDIQVDKDFIEAKMADNSSGDTQRLIVTIKENAPKGYFKAIIKVMTDDPEQPQVLVGVGGSIK